MDLRATATEYLNLLTDAFTQIKANDVFKGEKSTDVAKKAAITLVSTYTAYSVWKHWRKRLAYSRILEGIPKNTGLDEVNFGLFAVHVPPDDGADMLLRLNDGGSDNTVIPGLSYVKLFPVEPLIAVANHETAETLFKFTEKLPYEQIIIKMVFGGDNLIGMQTDKWRVRRRLINKCFHTGSYIDAVNNQCKTMVRHIKQKGSASAYTDLLFRRTATSVAVDIALEMLVGRDLAVQDTYNTTGKQPEWADHIEQLISTWGYVFDHPIYWNNWGFKLFDRKRYNSWQDQLSSLSTFLDGLIQERIDYNAQGTIVEDKLNVIDTLLKLLDNGDMTRQEIIPELLLFIGAGYDTSSSAMADGLAWLAKSDSIQEKLAAEIKDFVPDDMETMFIDDATLSKMPYVNCVVREILRYCAPVTATGRMVDTPVKFKNGQTLHASKEYPVDVLFLITKMNFCKKYWGNDADVFRPERHLESKRDLMTFSRGPRKCIGENMALTTMKIELIYLVKNFQFRCNEKLEGRKMVANMMLKFKDEPVIQFCNK